MRIAYCEDNELDRSTLQDYLDRYSADRSIHLDCVPYEYGMNFLHDMEEGAYFDVVFLDIYMEENVMGNEIARKLLDMGYNRKNIIFLTGSTQFAAESYRFDFGGYLTKPPEYELFERDLDKITQHTDQPVYLIKTKSGMTVIPHSEILYVESNDHQCTLHTTSGETHTDRIPLSAVETKLGDRRFLHCHKSYLVNMDHIRQFGKEILLSNGGSIPIRNHCAKPVRKAFMDYCTKPSSTARRKQEDSPLWDTEEMKLKKFYQQLGCDYTEIVSRMHTEKAVIKKLIIFSRNPFYQMLSDALLAGDCNKAFRAAHTLKSDFHTMSFSHLYPSIDEMTEQLKAGHMEQALPLFQQLQPEYERTMVVLRQYLESIQSIQ